MKRKKNQLGKYAKKRKTKIVRMPILRYTILATPFWQNQSQFIFRLCSVYVIQCQTFAALAFSTVRRAAKRRLYCFNSTRMTIQHEYTSSLLQILYTAGRQPSLHVALKFIEMNNYFRRNSIDTDALPMKTMLVAIIRVNTATA